MKAKLLFRIGSFLFVFFAVTHTLGLIFQPGASSEMLSVITSMKGVTFNASGFERSYWDYYFGFGLLFTAFMILSAIISWFLDDIKNSRNGIIIQFGFVIAQASVAVICWLLFFTAPAVTATIITGLLSAGLILDRK